MTKGSLDHRRAFHSHMDALHGAVEGFSKAWLRAHERYPDAAPLNLTYEALRASFLEWIRTGRLSAPLR